MSKKKTTAHQRLIAAAKRMLAAANAAQAVPRYNAKVAKIEGAAKRARRKENQPPPEQEAKAVFVEAPVNGYEVQYDEDGTFEFKKLKLGHAFKRQARFETIAGLTVPQLFALRRYRRAFDASELSPVKSALDIGLGGGGGGEAMLARIEVIASADISLRHIEAGIPAHHLSILRAVALYDRDFKDLALERFGSASGQRRTQVKDDFLAAAAAITEKAVNDTGPAKLAQGPAAAPPTSVAVPAAFLDERGFMRPMQEIADILRGGPESKEEAA